MLSYYSHLSATHLLWTATKHKNVFRFTMTWKILVTFHYPPSCISGALVMPPSFQMNIKLHNISDSSRASLKVQNHKFLLQTNLLHSLKQANAMSPIITKSGPDVVSGFQKSCAGYKWRWGQEGGADSASATQASHTTIGTLELPQMYQMKLTEDKKT